MIELRGLALASLLVAAVASEATAQFFGVPPRPQQPQAPNVCASFLPLRQDAETTMGAIKAATDRKAPREEFCQLFTKLSAASAKMSKFLEQHQTTCNVPADAVQRAKSEHGKVAGFRKQACATGPAPAGPKLSDVLGAPIQPDSSQDKANCGVFSTMTGCPLTR